MSSKNSKGRKALALLTAAATLAGGLTAGTAWAGGDGGRQPGLPDVVGPADQFWAYKDDASGSWGPATSIDSVANAMKAVNVTMNDASGKAAAALKDANDRCEAGFKQRHPGEGNGDCRVVAVGAVVGTNKVWEGSGHYSTSVWKKHWNDYVAPGTYSYAGSQSYRTSDGFNDDPDMSVDKLMEKYVDDTASIVVIALDK